MKPDTPFSAQAHGRVLLLLLRLCALQLKSETDIEFITFGNIRTAASRVIRGQGHVEDLGIRVHYLLHLLCELKHCVLVRVADVAWAHEVAFHELDQACNGVGDIAEATSLKNA